jgi:hypothetical protein
MIDIEWRLSLSVRCDTNARMPEWVKVSLARVKSRRARRERNATAVKKHGLSLFQRFAGLASTAINEFNEEDDLRSLTLTQGPPYTFTVQARGKEGARIHIGLDLEREVITYSYTNLDEAQNGELYLASDQGDGLILRHLNDHSVAENISEANALRELLEPVFESVY